MQKHVRNLGWCYIAMAVFDVLIGLFVFSVVSGAGAMSGDMQAFGTMAAIGGLVGSIMFVMAIPNLLCGLGFLKGWGGWVIILACILSVFNLAKFPIGTAIAVYTFWVAYKLYDAQPDAVSSSDSKV